MINMSLCVEIFAVVLAFLVGVAIRRYFILVSGSQKTNLPFIKDFNLLTGSKNIIFANRKVMAVNAYDQHQELGKTFGCYFGQNMQVFSSDPDLIYKVCVTDFQKHRNRYYVNSLSKYIRASLLEARDNHWQTSRRAIGSVLKASKLKIDNVDTDIESTITMMLKSIDWRLNEMKKNDGETIFDVYQINKNFFMQSILKIIYDQQDLVDFDNEYNDVVEDLYSFINVNYEFVARLCFLIPSLNHLVRPLIDFFDHGKFLNILKDKIEKILGRTLKEHQSGGRRLTTIHSMISSYRFATSVDTMSALMWELACNQEVQNKLRADLQQYGEGSTYLNQCINETLRLYPGSLTAREMNEDVYHEDFRLIKGSCLNVSIYMLHRDHKYWGPDANVWRPERFDPNLVASFHPAQFIPFGIGPRNCVGYNLAKMELSKFTVQFVLRYKIDFCSKTQSKIAFVPLGALPYALPVKGPIHLKLSHVSSVN